MSNSLKSVLTSVGLRLFRDCCYNHQDYATSCPLNNGGEKVFLDTLRGYESYFQCTFDAISKTRYWMISSCPESWNGPNGCNDVDDAYNHTVGRLDRGLSSIPVESLDGITFRNIHCALCHGKNTSELTPWSFDADECIDADILDANSTSTIREKVEYLVKNCSKVSFLPPGYHPNHSLSVIPCHKVKDDVIDTCESTTIAGSIIENCSIIVDPINVNGKQFKNTFCVNCYNANQNSSEVVIVNSCIAHSPPYIPPCLYDFETGVKICPTPPPPPPLVPISITFNFGGQNEGASVSKAGNNIETISVVCNMGQVFDPLKSKCVQLTCPDGYYLTESLCSEIPTVDLNTTSLCEIFALNMTFGPLKNVGLACPLHAESFLSCLPQDILLAIETSTLNKNVPCDTLARDSHMPFQALTTSVDTITKLLSTFDVKTSTTIQSKVCSTLGFVEIIAYCTSFHSNGTFDCHSEWLNNSHWYIEDKSLGEIVIKYSSENISISETKIRHHFGYSNDQESLVTRNISILRCNFTHDVKSSCPLVKMNSSLFKFDKNDSDILVYSLNESIRLTPGMYKFLQNGSIQIRKSSHLRKSTQHNYHREALIYIKIFVILGLTWVIGFVATITNVQVLWYLFTILTSLQGVFIFLAFTVKSQIWKMWGKRTGFIAFSSTSTEQTRGYHSEHEKHSRKEIAVTTL
ncbi:hypothetical protein HOLleu_29639 [Holothuria leucospilota]|uniref:Uncharacterized protein n=1 Tax=Holothuria leucospilota TaxID=206669 RepID=A0A9Q1BP79_HOLLE|nr:hypothetical protein HOLleu_29639 [Holothuria leucospilota]